MKSKIYNALKGVMFKEKTKDDYTSELVDIAEEFAIEFAEWKDNYLSNKKIIFENYTKTTKELLEIYKKEKDEQNKNIPR
jgi:hypothetical protein